MNNKGKITKIKLNKNDISKISGGILAPTSLRRHPVGISEDGKIKYAYEIWKHTNFPYYNKATLEGEYDTLDEAMKHAYDIEKNETESNSVTAEELDEFLSKLPGFPLNK